PHGRGSGSLASAGHFRSSADRRSRSSLADVRDRAGLFGWNSRSDSPSRAHSFPRRGPVGLLRLVPRSSQQSQAIFPFVFSGSHLERSDDRRNARLGRALHAGQAGNHSGVGIRGRERAASGSATASGAPPAWWSSPFAELSNGQREDG